METGSIQRDNLSKVLAEATLKDAAVEEEQRDVAIAKNQIPSPQEAAEDASFATYMKRIKDEKIKPHSSTEKAAKDKKAAQTKLMPPEAIEKEAQSFSKKNPQFPTSKLVALTAKLQLLKDGKSREDILKLLQEEYPNPIDANLALEFLISISLDDYKAFLGTIQSPLTEEMKQREEEVSKKFKDEAVQATKEANEAALRLVQGGDLDKLIEHLMLNPLEATAIFKMLDEGFGKNSKKIELFIMKKCGEEVKQLKLDDKESIAEMKVAMRLLKIMQAIRGVKRYFAFRNQESKVGERKQREKDKEREREKEREKEKEKEKARQRAA